MGNHQFAIEDFNQALKLDPKSREAYYFRGVSQMKSKTFKEAEEDFLQAMSLQEGDETFPATYDGLGCCYLALHDYDQALTYFDMAVDKDQSNPNFKVNRAQCHFMMGDLEKSIEDLEAANEDAGEEPNPSILYKLGLAYFSDEKYKRAIRTLKHAIRAKPAASYLSDVYYHIAIAFS